MPGGFSTIDGPTNPNDPTNIPVADLDITTPEGSPAKAPRVVIGIGRGTNYADIDPTNPFPVAPAVPNTDFAVSQVTVGTIPIDLTPTPMPNRKRLRIQNRGPGDVGLIQAGGMFGVSWILGAGDKEEFDAGPNLQFFGISDTDGNDVRILETA